MEHRHYGQLETFAAWQEKVIVHFLAAGPLSIQKGSVEKGTSRVGIDFDKFGATERKMKVIAHEDAQRSEVLSCYFWCEG